MDAQALLGSFGYLIIFLSVFIESGVIIGLVLPLPGFSLLFTAGVFAASSKQFDTIAIIAVGFSAAVLGYIVGYFTGSHYGRKLFYEKNTSKYFTKEQGLATEKFMKKYGYSTLIIGRFLPIIHSLIPIMSGIAKTPFAAFMIVNVLGALVWTISATMLGYYLGQSVPNAQYYIIPFVVASLVVANTPIGKRLISKITKRIDGIEEK